MEFYVEVNDADSNWTGSTRKYNLRSQADKPLVISMKNKSEVNFKYDATEKKWKVTMTKKKQG